MSRGNGLAVCYLLSVMRDARIAVMSFKVEHNYRFDSAGKLDADDWITIPRAELRADFLLDADFADEMVRRYSEMVAQAGPGIRVVSDAQGVRYLAPLGKTAMVFAEPERIVDAERAETSWLIAGGFLLAHRVSYGGRFYIGGEWDKDGALKLYSSIRRYPPRLINWFGVTRGASLYHRTQGASHRQTQEKFLSAMAARVTRPSP